jgi:hypothetical protein
MHEYKRRGSEKCPESGQKLPLPKTQRDKMTSISLSARKILVFQTWDSGFTENSGTDKNSSAEIKPFPFRSNWQNRSYKEMISLWETACGVKLPGIRIRQTRNNPKKFRARKTSLHTSKTVWA